MFHRREFEYKNDWTLSVFTENIVAENGAIV